MKRVRHVVVESILHLDDSPHRIALGGSIAVFVACSPWIGFHMLLAVALAAVFRANKAVTVPMVWIHNPVTMVPMFWIEYKIGQWILTGKTTVDATTTEQIHEFIKLVEHGQVLSREFWRDVLVLTGTFGHEWLVGSAVFGGTLALATYWPMRYAIVRYRRAKARRHDVACGGVGEGVSAVNVLGASIESAQCEGRSDGPTKSELAEQDNKR